MTLHQKHWVQLSLALVLYNLNDFTRGLSWRDLYVFWPTHKENLCGRVKSACRHFRNQPSYCSVKTLSPILVPEKIRPERLAFTQKGLTRDNACFQYLFVCAADRKTGTGLHCRCLALCVCRGWVAGGGSHGAPQNWVRGINFLAWSIQANGRLAWEVSLPKQPLHPQPSQPGLEVKRHAAFHTPGCRVMPLYCV